MCKCCNNTTSPKARGGIVFRCSYPEVLCRKTFAIFTRKSTMTFIFNKVGLQLYKLTKRGSVQNFSKQLQFRRTPLNDELLLTLREKCPNTVFFQVRISRTRTIRKIRTRKNSAFGYFSRSASIYH